MSLSQAQSWLKKHSDSIPALNINHQKIIELLDSEKNSQDIVLHALADPGLSLALLKKVNADRGTNSAKDRVESTRSAITLLGNQVTHSLLRKYSVAEKKLNNPQQLFLFHQIINRSFHNEVQVTAWAEGNGYQHKEQLKACALLSYTGEILCCVYDFEHYLQYILGGSVIGEEQQIFGFSFPQLTEALCLKLNLPEIFIQALPHKESDQQREKFLCFIAKLCHQCEHGWFTKAQFKTFNLFAEFLQHPVDQVIQKFHQVSVHAARQSILEDAWQAASRLILISDSAWIPADPAALRNAAVDRPKSAQPDFHKTEKPGVKETHKTSSADDIFSRIKNLVKQQNVTKSIILNTCINGLFEDFSMSKVSLLLLSQDKHKLHNRMSRGIPKEAAFNQYQIETSKAGLLKILLNKPQAIWINETSLKKYHKIIPASLLASIMTTDFLAMSLFIGEKPIGIIYADRTETTDKLDEKAFTQFKQLISLTSKVLTVISKR